MNKKIIFAIVIVAIVAVCGLFLTIQKDTVTNAGSAVGTSYQTQRIAQKNISPTVGATTTSMYNGDDSDRWILSNFAACSQVGTSRTAYTGAGLASLTVTSATTTTNAPAAITNSSTVTLTIATSSTEFMINTASTGSTSSYLTRWAAGTYYTWAFNATNTAACTVGVSYIGS